MRPISFLGVLVAGACATVACSGNVDPLGGPYGGATSAVGPTAGGTSGGPRPDGGGASSSPGSGTGSGSSGGTGSGGGSSSSSGSSSGGGSSGTGSGSTSGSSSSGSSSGGQTAPTWTKIWTAYLDTGTPGNCTPCHSEMGSPASAYSWLKGRGYIGGGSPALTSSSTSCLSWYGGNMPPSGPSTLAQAVTDMSAWAAAGALDN